MGSSVLTLKRIYKFAGNQQMLQAIAKTVSILYSRYDIMVDRNEPEWHSGFISNFLWLNEIYTETIYIVIVH